MGNKKRKEEERREEKREEEGKFLSKERKKKKPKKKERSYYFKTKQQFFSLLLKERDSKKTKEKDIFLLFTISKKLIFFQVHFTGTGGFKSVQNLFGSTLTNPSKIVSIVGKIPPNMREKISCLAQIPFLAA